ncbi:GIY-YIG nuclease family protein [Amphritea sp. 2_MG-2023]|uniref:GIY-YIG nuclease family protein n=1 Tax=Amphritea TaxID=515417 RepID=UPI001C0659C8|nr:GIY-YIG nuclease family protein [Amphritea sp. 2_MG-2023]MBU2966927.1 GIY-YIG nuclease family protein [Amphritea atlantica]MDO6420741.1 GIY-YIG nuclease family protein [Amphritea sp. 2_MG-2023]
MGKKITIFMIDGVPEGAKTYEIGNWSGKAISCPRSNAKSILLREEFENAGVYFLRSTAGSSDYDDAIYIGEAESLGIRIKQHLSGEKDFDSFICFYSKDDMLTKAHIKYLESRLVTIAKEAKSSEVLNSNQPTLSKLSEADISDMEYFIDQLALILPVAGIRSLISSVASQETKTKSESGKLYSLKSNRLNASMVEVSEGYLVRAGSQFALEETDSIAEGWKKLRAKLIDEGLVDSTAENGVFLEDVLFSSPSAASSTILGAQSPGPIRWIDENGNTFKDNQESSM